MVEYRAKNMSRGHPKSHRISQDLQSFSLSIVSRTGVYQGSILMNIIEFVNQYGLPITVAGGMGYFIFFVYSFITKEMKPKLGEASTVLIALIDRIRMLDNDIIRLKSKVNTVIEYKEREKLLGSKKSAPKQKS